MFISKDEYYHLKNSVEFLLRRVKDQDNSLEALAKYFGIVRLDTETYPLPPLIRYEKKCKKCKCCSSTPQTIPLVQPYGYGTGMLCGKMCDCKCHKSKK